MHCIQHRLRTQTKTYVYVRTSEMQYSMGGKSRDWREPISALTSSVTLGAT